MSGALLGGRVIHRQADSGHRTGIEPVLLAASVPARTGESVLEGGSGSGAGLLCLAARVAGVTGLGVEIDAGQVAIAAGNAAANGFGGLAFGTGDVTAWRGERAFDHAMANPPWHDPAGTVSPDGGRARAKRGADGLLAAWAAGLARAVRGRGTVTLVVGVASVPAALAGLAASGCGSLALLPLWPREGVAAKIVLVRGVKGGRGAFRLLPGLVLHRADGAFTDAADAVLRGGAGLEL